MLLPFWDYWLEKQDDRLNKAGGKIYIYIHLYQEKLNLSINSNFLNKLILKLPCLMHSMWRLQICRILWWFMSISAVSHYTTLCFRYFLITFASTKTGPRNRNIKIKISNVYYYYPWVT